MAAGWLRTASFGWNAYWWFSFVGRRTRRLLRNHRLKSHPCNFCFRTPLLIFLPSMDIGVALKSRGGRDGFRRRRIFCYRKVYIARLGGREHDHVPCARNGELPVVWVFFCLPSIKIGVIWDHHGLGGDPSNLMTSFDPRRANGHFLACGCC